MLVKVCGLREPDNIREIASLDIDWIGFIFWEKSVRAMLGAPNIVPETPDRKRVGVFVNASVEEMRAKAAAYRLDCLQLHGNESPSMLEELKQDDLTLIKAFPVASAADLEQTAAYENGMADYFLFDTKCEGYGGSGRTFDWSTLEAYHGSVPFMLSGGIKPSSVEAIRAFAHPRFAGIDLNSGFESSAGVKEAGKLRDFITSIKK